MTAKERKERTELKRLDRKWVLRRATMREMLRCLRLRRKFDRGAVWSTSTRSAP